MEEYKLKTFRDVWDKVPTDRIKDCLNELGMLLSSGKAMQEVFHSVAEQESGVKLPGKLFEFPEEITWVDDGKGHIENRFDDLFSVAIKRSSRATEPGAAADRLKSAAELECSAVARSLAAAKRIRRLQNAFTFV